MYSIAIIIITTVTTYYKLKNKIYYKTYISHTYNEL